MAKITDISVGVKMNQKSLKRLNKMFNKVEKCAERAERALRRLENAMDEIKEAQPIEIDFEQKIYKKGGLINGFSKN